MARPQDQRKHGVTREKRLDKEVISTCLYMADKLVLDNEVKRTGKTKAEVLREVFHAYAMKKRFGATESDEATFISMLKKLSEDMAATRASVEASVKQGGAIAKSLADFEEFSQTEFMRMFATNNAQYNLSAQSFTVLWALADFFQRFIAIPMLARNEETKGDPNGSAAVQLQEARSEGLQVAERFTDEIESPTKVKMILVGANK